VAAGGILCSDPMDELQVGRLTGYREPEEHPFIRLYTI
jgi:hypothetical protein